MELGTWNVMLIYLTWKVWTISCSKLSLSPSTVKLVFSCRLGIIDLSMCPAALPCVVHYLSLAQQGVGLVSWSLTSLFSTNMAISETKGVRCPIFHAQINMASWLLTALSGKTSSSGDEIANVNFFNNDTLLALQNSPLLNIQHEAGCSRLGSGAASGRGRVVLLCAASATPLSAVTK